jgi:hypothetical protein
MADQFRCDLARLAGDVPCPVCGEERQRGKSRRRLRYVVLSLRVAGSANAKVTPSSERKH